MPTVLPVPASLIFTPERLDLLDGDVDAGSHHWVSLMDVRGQSHTSGFPCTAAPFNHGAPSYTFQDPDVVSATALWTYRVEQYADDVHHAFKHQVRELLLCQGG